MSAPFEDLPLDVQEPATYRQSLLTMADACTYAGGLYVQGQPPGHQLYRGSVLHEAFDLAVKTLTAAGEKTLAPDDGKAILEEVIRAHPSWVIPASELDAMRVQMQHWCEHFVLPDGAMSEIPYRLEIGGKVCTGTVDLAWVVDDTLHVRDWKTGYNLYAQDDVAGKNSEGVPKGAKSSQLIQYVMGLVDGQAEDFKMPRGVNYFDAAFVFPMFATEHGMVERGLVMGRPELIEHRTWLEMLVARMGHAFSEQQFTAVPGSHCSRCPNSAACPIPTEAKGTGPFEGDPIAAAMEWARKDAEVSRLLGDLKAYCKEMGPLEFGDQRLGFKLITSSRTPKKVKERVLAGEFVPPDEMYVPSVSTRFGLEKL